MRITTVIIPCLIFLASCGPGGSGRTRHISRFPLPNQARNTAATVILDGPKDQCTAVFIASGGVATTAAHCLEAISLDGSAEYEPLIVDWDSDVALVRFMDQCRWPAETVILGDDRLLVPGDRIYAIGYPAGRFLLMNGYVRARYVDWSREPGEADWPCSLISGLAVGGGSSGSGVYSATDGRLVGIHVASEDGKISCAISVRNLRSLMAEAGIKPGSAAAITADTSCCPVSDDAGQDPGAI